jgi:hypothetical protein
MGISQGEERERVYMVTLACSAGAVGPSFGFFPYRKYVLDIKYVRTG